MEKTSHSAPRFVYVAAALSAIGGFLFGYDTGVISGALLSLRHDFQLSLFEQEVLVAALSLAAAFTVPFAGQIADRLGRRRSIVSAAALFVFGAALMATAPNYTILLMGRLILGGAIGVASLTVPLYISEISPPGVRGLTVSMNQMLITIGILTSYTVDLAFAREQAWRWMTGASLVPALILLIAMWLLPSSPRWLLKRGREAEARRVFKRMGVADSDMDSTCETIKRHLHAHRGGWKALLAKPLRRPLLTGMALSVFQQITGINTVIYYAPIVFQLSGFTGDVSALFATVGVGVVNVLMTIVSLWLLDRAGRRPLLLFGLSAMIIGMGMLGVTWLLPEGIIRHTLPILSIMLFIAGFAVGLGTVAWLFVAEIYPLHVRGLAMSCGVTLNWLSNFVVSVTFLTLTNWLGPSLTFWIYALIGAICLLFVICCIPETKGRTLEQIESFWEEKLPKGLTTRID